MEGINLANITKATRTFVLSPTKLTFDQLSKGHQTLANFLMFLLTSFQPSVQAS